MLAGFQPISGAARLAGVIGWPVAHSLSPRLQGFWLREHQIDGAYVPLPVRPNDFSASLRALSSCGFAGVNVTIPHKESAVALCDELTEDARAIGAVNTVTFDKSGRLKGHNSDGFGFLENLKQGAPTWRPDESPALILGAGGAARAIIHVLLKAGVPEIRLTNRTRARAEKLATEFGSLRVVEWEEHALAARECGLLVNTTSLGMTGTETLEFNLDNLPKAAVVTDIVYKPLETKLLADARARGNPTVDGLGMLLHQARPGFEAWFGVSPNVSDELRSFVLAGLTP